MYITPTFQYLVPRGPSTTRHWARASCVPWATTRWRAVRADVSCARPATPLLMVPFPPTNVRVYTYVFKTHVIALMYTYSKVL